MRSKPPVRLPTILQKLATERDWYRWFVIKPINLNGLNFNRLSTTTIQQERVVNREIEKLRELFDEDWKREADRLRK